MIHRLHIETAGYVRQTLVTFDSNAENDTHRLYFNREGTLLLTVPKDSILNTETLDQMPAPAPLDPAQHADLA